MRRSNTNRSPPATGALAEATIFFDGSACSATVFRQTDRYGADSNSRKSALSAL
jgi:hypothetical protein